MNRQPIKVPGDNLIGIIVTYTITILLWKCPLCASAKSLPPLKQNLVKFTETAELKRVQLYSPSALLIPYLQVLVIFYYLALMILVFIH